MRSGGEVRLGIGQTNQLGVKVLANTFRQVFKLSIVESRKRKQSIYIQPPTKKL
jgi:hypothetical protein